MLGSYELWFVPCLLFALSAWAVSSSWRRQGMSLRRLWAPSAACAPDPSSASSSPLDEMDCHVRHHRLRATTELSVLFLAIIALTVISAYSLRGM